MLDNETKRRIDTARDILVGKLPDPKSQVEQITIALIYKFMDDLDAESVSFGGEPFFFTGDYEKYGWRKLLDLNLSGFETLALYGEAMTKLHENENLPQLFRDIFKNAYLPYRDPETLKLFLKTINGFTYDHSERLGDAFEYLLSVLGSQGDAGQFRTPRHIIDFIVEILDPQKTETISDPACGTAGFLISAYKHILAANQNLTPDERKKLMTNFAGYDISPDMVRLSLVNMYLHGFPSPHIYEYDSLTSEDRWSETFDIVMANPPFMSPKGGIKPHKKFSINANRSEVLFVDYIAEHIHPTHGRAGIIVPEGIIFQAAGAYRDLRKMLVDKKFLYAVVSLPAGVFQPYSGVKTSVLLMDKTIAAKTDKILFVKIQNDGYGLGAQRRELATSDLPDALDLIRDFQAAVLHGDISHFEGEDLPLQAVAVEKTQIAANGDYNLSGDRYKTALVHNHNFEAVALREIADVISGQSPEGEFYNQTADGLPFYQGKTEFGKIYIGEPKTWTTKTTKLAGKNDILMSVRAPVGPVNISTQQICIGRGLAAIRPNKKVEQMFLFHYLKAIQDQIKGNGGAVFDSINRQQIEEIKIPLPPLSIQKEIVEKIEGFQRIIDGAKQVVENYKPQIDISPDWEMVELGEVFKTKSGTTPSRSRNDYFENGSISWVKTLDLNNSSIHLTHEKITQKALDETHLEVLPKKTVLIAMYGGFNQIGRTGVLEIEATTNQAITALLPNKAVDSYYLNSILVSSREHWKKVANSTRKDPNITKGDVLKFQIPLPPFEVQQEIVARIEREQSLVNSNKELITIFEAKIKDEINKLWEE